VTAAAGLLPALLAAPLAGALLARLGRARALRVLAPALELLLAALAVAGTSTNAVLGWSIGVGPVRAGFALDRLSAWLLLLVAVLACLAVGTAPAAGDPRRRDFDAGLQLFVACAAVVCLAANLACLLGAFELAAFGTCALAARQRGALAARPVLLLNSAIGFAFAAALACIAAATGTLDTAALALSAPAAPPGAAAWLTLAGYLLFAGFAGAFLLLPLALALPAAAPVALRLAGLALAGLAASSIMRLYTLVFPCFTAGPCGPSALALPFGLAALSGAALATLLAASLREFVAYLLLVMLSTQLIAVGSFRAGGFAAAVFFLGHALLAGAALLLAADALPRAAGTAPSTPRDRAARALLAASLLTAASAPPSAGFVGLVAILRASGPDALAVWTLLGVSTLLVVAAMRRVLSGADANAGPEPPRRTPLWPAAVALAAALALAVLARPGYEFASAAARQLLDRGAYARGIARTVGSGPEARHYRELPPLAKRIRTEEIP
jgi:multicomponent K+:H+ antiporter subunit D